MDVNESYVLFDDPFKMYAAIFSDLEQADRFIYVETYRIANDSIGQRLREILVRKSAEGVKVKILVDSWGTSLSESFFEEIIKNGGELRYFKKIKLYFDFFTKNHRRNHRKLLIIDNKVSYMGSTNFTAYSLNWREMVVRISGPLTPYFTKTFADSYRLFQKYVFKKYSYRKTIRFRDFEIVRDLPSIYRQQVKNKFEQLIRNANQSIYIETPYFLPGYKLRKELTDAAQRGVDVKVFLPLRSDVRLVDILRRRYLGLMFGEGVEFLFYQAGNLHAKTMLVDNEIFSIGSANFDYRSFRYMFEMVLIGRNKDIVRQLADHMSVTLANCIGFDYPSWQNRPRIDRFFEWILIPFRHLL